MPRFFALFLALTLGFPAPARALRNLNLSENAGLEEELSGALNADKEDPGTRESLPPAPPDLAVLRPGDKTPLARGGTVRFLLVAGEANAQITLEGIDVKFLLRRSSVPGFLTLSSSLRGVILDQRLAQGKEHDPTGVGVIIRHDRVETGFMVEIKLPKDAHEYVTGVQVEGVPVGSGLEEDGESQDEADDEQETGEWTPEELGLPGIPQGTPSADIKGQVDDMPSLGLAAASAQYSGDRRMEDAHAVTVLETAGGTKVGMLALVADGMGGHPEGDEASRMAGQEMITHFQAPHVVDVFSQWADAPQGDWAFTEVYAQTLLAFNQANKELKRRNPRMGTALALLILAGKKGLVASMGDCRIYRLRDGLLELLTSDQNRGWEAAEGKVPEHPDLSAGRRRLEVAMQARKEKGRNVLTNNLGREDDVARLEVEEIEMEGGDRFLLVTDGMNVLREQEIERMLADAGTPIREVVRQLMEKAPPGGDNRTAVGIEVRTPPAGQAGLEEGDKQLAELKRYIHNLRSSLRHLFQSSGGLRDQLAETSSSRAYVDSIHTIVSGSYNEIDQQCDLFYQTFAKDERDGIRLGLPLLERFFDLFRELEGLLQLIDEQALLREAGTEGSLDWDMVKMAIRYSLESEGHIHNALNGIEDLLIRMDLRTILFQHMSAWQGMVQPHTLNMELTGTALPAQVDKIDFVQVLENYVRNAVEALNRTGRVGEITVSARMDGDVIEISVADTGLGHDPETIWNGKTSKTDAVSHGIGLGFVRSKVEGWRGIVDSSHREGGGSVFTLLLPRAAGLKEAITSARFMELYGAQMEQLPVSRRDALRGRLSDSRVAITDVILPDTLLLYAQGIPLWEAVISGIAGRAPEGLRFDTQLLPVEEWSDIGLIFKEPGSTDPLNPRGLPIYPLDPAQASQVDIRTLLSIMLGRPESADILVELFKDANGRTHVLIFA